MMRERRIKVGSQEVVIRPFAADPVTPSMSTDVTYQVQFIEESTAGTFPASGTFTYVAPMARTMIQAGRGVTPIGNIGTFDIRTQVKGVKTTAFVLGDMTPYNTTFMKQAINRTGTNSLAQSVGVLMKANIGGTAAANQNYISANFGRHNAITIAGYPGLPLSMDSVVVTRFPTIGTADPCSGITKVSDPGTAPWGFSDGGDTPINIDGATPTVGLIEVSVTNNLRAIYGVGPEEHVALPTRGRDIVGRIAILQTGTTHWTNFANMTGGTITWTLKTGSGTLTLADYAFGNAQFGYTAGGDEVYEVYPLRAKTITVS